MARGKRTPPDVREAIERLAIRGFAASDIETELGKDDSLRDRVPELRTIQLIARQVRSQDASGRWSMAEAGEGEAQHVLPVLAALLEASDGAPDHRRVDTITKAEARWIARLRGAVPSVDQLDPISLYRYARRYVAAETAKAPTDALDRSFARFTSGDKRASVRDSIRAAIGAYREAPPEPADNPFGQPKAAGDDR
ncbi:MAG: hypothetical protein ABI841_02850 [Chloroflexota bacterium]